VRRHREHRTGRLAQQGLGDGSEEQPFESPAAVRAHHHQIRSSRNRLIDDHRPRVAGRDGEGCLRAQGVEIEGATHLRQHLVGQHRHPDGHHRAEIAERLRRFQDRHDVQHAQLRRVPAGEDCSVSQRAR
jgi:hypothetical protein